MKSLLVAAIASMSVPQAGAPQIPDQEMNQRVRVLEATCDQQLAVRRMTIAVAKPGIYIFEWDNADTCTPEKDSK